MKLKNTMSVAVLVAMSAWNSVAQDATQRPNRPRPNGPSQGGQRPSQPGRPQQGGQQGGDKKPMMIPPVIGALDANHDRNISADEIANASTALKVLDKNSDGQLSGEEIRPLPPLQPQQPRQNPNGGQDGGQNRAQQRPPLGGGGKFRPMVPPLIATMDANHDGTLSADELANAQAALLKLDKNGDGQLQAEELRPEGHKPPNRQN